jgi:AraC-like DNA-binding protein
MTFQLARSEPRQLVENRVSFAGPSAELSIYDTYEPAESVVLQSGDVMYCGMLTGRKIMHGATATPRAFVPGESFVLAPHQKVWIDFPGARYDQPTTCMTVEIRPERVEQVCHRLNEQLSRERDFGPWRWHRDRDALHVTHGRPTQHLVEHLMLLYIHGHPDRHTLIDVALDELTIRMLRTQSRELLLTARQRCTPRHGIDAALDWLDEHLADPLDIQQLTNVACMSRASLYRRFKRELGTTPFAHQQWLRIERAKQWLAEPDGSISGICFDLGFASLSHFAHRFKAHTGLAPSVYRAHALQRAMLPQR